MSKKTYRRELIEWMILVTVGLVLYVTGMHTVVIGQIQSVVLSTGLIEPDQTTSDIKADYDFVLTDINDQPQDFSELKGDVIFLNFWATWCPPCIAEMPDIESLYQKMGKNVKFVMISVDKDQQKARNFIERKGYEMPVYFANRGVPSVFQSSSIPTTYVISKEGKIVVRQKGMAQYDSEEFREFLAGLVKEK